MTDAEIADLMLYFKLGLLVFLHHCVEVEDATIHKELKDDLRDPE